MTDSDMQRQGAHVPTLCACKRAVNVPADGWKDGQGAMCQNTVVLASRHGFNATLLELG